MEYVERTILFKSGKEDKSIVPLELAEELITAYREGPPGITQKYDCGGRFRVDAINFFEVAMISYYKPTDTL